MTMPSCDVITRDRQCDVELMGRRRRTASSHTCCCPRWFASSSPECADSAALYEFNYAQRTVSGGETADKRPRPSPRCLFRDHASLPPLLPPPPPSRDRHPECADPPSLEDLTWTRLGGIEHDVYVERCRHAAVHCPSSFARHLLVPATATYGPPSATSVHYYTRNQLVSTDDEQSVPTALSTAAELQLNRPVDSHQQCGTIS